MTLSSPPTLCGLRPILIERRGAGFKDLLLSPGHRRVGNMSTSSATSEWRTTKLCWVQLSIQCPWKLALLCRALLASESDLPYIQISRKWEGGGENQHALAGLAPLILTIWNFEIWNIVSRSDICQGNSLRFLKLGGRKTRIWRQAAVKSHKGWTKLQKPKELWLPLRFSFFSLSSITRETIGSS